MAVEVIQQRWCDWHLRVGVPEGDKSHVEGIEFQVAFTPSAHGAQPMVVDLCEACMKRFGDPIMELVATLTPAKQAQRTTTTGKVSAKHREHFCPMAGCDKQGTPSILKNHVASKHQTTLGQVAFIRGETLEGTKVIYACSDHEDGPFGFGKPQAMIQHRLQGHGDKPGFDVDKYRTDSQQERLSA